MWIEIYMLTRLSLEKWVTPFAGVWIEIKPAQPEAARHTVTPFAGVWIEMELARLCGTSPQASLPSRECGLKYVVKLTETNGDSVTPFAGVWIEIG